MSERETQRKTPRVTSERRATTGRLVPLTVNLRVSVPAGHVCRDLDVVRRRALMNWEADGKREAARLAKAIVCRDYFELVAALTARREQLGLSQLELDAMIGQADGLTGHRERPKAAHGRACGAVGLSEWLQALGLEIRVVPIASTGEGKRAA